MKKPGLVALFVLLTAYLEQPHAIADRLLGAELQYPQQHSMTVANTSVSNLLSWRVHPRAIPADGLTQTVITVTVSNPQAVSRVWLDLAAVGGSKTTPLFDDGAHNDSAAGDGTYGMIATAPVAPVGGVIPLNVAIIDQQGSRVNGFLGTLAVLTPLHTPWPAGLPSYLGWGTGEEQWQRDSGLAWNYETHFLTWDWQTWNPNFVGNYAQRAWSWGYIPVFTFDMLHGAASCNGLGERDCDYAHLQDAALMQGYFDRLRTAARQANGTQPVIFHIEPDAVAYMHRHSIERHGTDGIRADDPSSIPARSVNPAYPDTFAGVVTRMVDLVHQEAPNVLVALHARSWATGVDLAGDTNPNRDVDAIASRTASFLKAAAGQRLDLIVVDWKTSDAGSGDSPWWDDTNSSLPHFNRILYFQNQIAVHSGLRLLLWKLPAGNMGLANTCERYQDNRVDYAFTHARDLVDAGIVGIAIAGSGNCRTSPLTDEGNIAARAAAYYAPPTAPTGFAASALGSPGLVKVSWSPNAEFDLWGYRLYYGRAPQTPIGYLDARRRTSWQTVLPSGGEWSLSVAAYDARGIAGPRSAEIVITVDEPYHAFLPLVRH